MKKVLSIFLSVLIICLSFLVTVVTGQTDDLQSLNLLINGDFADDSNFDTTTKNYKGAVEGHGKWINIATGVSNFAYTANEGVNGSGAIKATIPPERYIRTFGQVLTVETNTDYIITFKSKGNIDGKINAGAFYSSTHATTNCSVSEDSYVVLEATEDWKDYTVKFNSGNVATIAVAFGGMADADAGKYYLIDDVCLYKADTVAAVNAVAQEGGKVFGGGYYVPNTKAELTAVADADYAFDGWYVGEQKVSSDATMEVEATKDNETVVYTAKFTEKNFDPDELLYDGGFDKTTKVASAEGADIVTYESAHVWYKPSSNAAITTDGTNKVLNLNSWIYQSVKVEENTSYILTFKAKDASTDLNINVYVRNLRNRSESIFYKKTETIPAGGDWAEYSVIINIKDFIAGVTDYTLGLQSGDGNSVLLDDVSLKEFKNYKVEAVAGNGGTANVSKGIANEGEVVTFIAIPEENYEFIGWFSDGETQLVSTESVYEVAVTGDIKLTAKFTSKEVADPDELLYDGGFDKTTKVASAEGADIVTYESAHVWYKPSSNSTIASDGDNKVLNLNSWIYQSVKVEENTTYVLRFKAKDASTDLNINVYVRNLRNRSETIFYKKTETIPAGGDWAEYSVIIDIKDFIAGVTDYALGLQSGDGNSVLLDDVSFKKINSYRVEAVVENGGSATVNKPLANEGDVVTFTATPNKNYKFIGWFREGESAAISTDTVYSVTITGDTKLTAKFVYEGVVDPDELIFDGGFDFTNALVGAESYDVVTYESAHVWYKPPTGSEIKKDGDNSVLKLGSWAYQSVKIKENTTYILKFRAKGASSDLKITPYIRNLRDRAQILAKGTPAVVSKGADWKEYVLLIEVKSLFNGVVDYTFAIHAGDGNTVLVDDISLKVNDGSILSVDTTNMRGGTATVEPTIVTNGSTVTFTATPEDGNNFQGWYLEGSTNLGAISTDPVFTTTVTENIKLIAVFGGDKYPNNTYNWFNPDAEIGTTEGWLNIQGKGSLSVTTNDVRSGKYSFVMNKDTDEVRTAMITKDGILLKGGHKYTITCDLRSRGARIRPFLSTSAEYKEGQTDLVYNNGEVMIRSDIEFYHTFGEDGRPEKRTYSSVLISNGTYAYTNTNGWTKYTMTFELPQAYDGTIVYFGLQCRTGIGTGMLDNLTVIEEKLDLSPKKSNKLYGEWVYNRLENGSFEKDAGGFTDLPKGFNISSANSYDGAKHLSVAANSGAYVKEVNLAKANWYHLVYFIKASQKGTSYIGVTFEKPSDNADFSNPEKLGISAFYPNATNKWYRDGFKFHTTNTTVAYIVIYSGSNAMEIDDLSLFADKHALAEDPNHPTLLPEYDYEGDGILYDKYDLMYQNVEGFDGASPGTGDEAYPLALIVITLLLSSAAMIVTKSKRRVK